VGSSVEGQEGGEDLAVGVERGEPVDSKATEVTWKVVDGTIASIAADGAVTALVAGTSSDYFDLRVR
jgi:hypothetical protein